MRGILVPAGTPNGIIEILNREIIKVMALPGIKERMAEPGFEAIANTR
jgi:tripartite-type tricarboxylate transporter receptor subunit TctC